MKASLADKWIDSFQGEQPLLGTPVRIIRFFGCNLAESCPLDCDTKYSWDRKSSKIIDCNVRDTLRGLTKNRSVMITGGEPFFHFDQLYSLVKECDKRKVQRVIIETNGTLITEYQYGKSVNQFCDMVHLSISPKIESSFQILNYYNCFVSKAKVTLKIVVGVRNPPKRWISQIIAAFKMGFQIALMPEGSTPEEIMLNLPRVEEFGNLLKIPYVLSPRLHIFMRIP